MMKRYCVSLTPEHRSRLESLVAAGTAPTRSVTHARILLKADQSPAGAAWTDARIAEALDISIPTVERVRRRYVLEGLDAALVHRPPARHRPRRLDGDQEAHLVALACSPVPSGHARWTLRLLADRMVELQYTDTVSYETVRTTLKKTHSSRG